MRKKRKILETRHAKKRYYLVFNEMEIVGKFEELNTATAWMKEQITLNKQASDA